MQACGVKVSDAAPSRTNCTVEGRKREVKIRAPQIEALLGIRERTSSKKVTNWTLLMSRAHGSLVLGERGAAQMQMHGSR